MPEQPSARQQACQRIADAIIENGLANPFGGDVFKDGRYYSTLFSIPRLLDGVVRLYSEKFIQVQAEGPLGKGHSAVYTSVDDAVEAILCICVVGDRTHDDLAKIPTKD